MNEIKTIFTADGKTLKELFLENDELLYLDKVYKHISPKFDKSYIKDYVTSYEVRIYKNYFDITIYNESEMQTMLDQDLNTLTFEALL